MTVTTQQSRISYDTDGVTVLFPFPFYFINNADLVVVKQAADGSEQATVLDSDYSVSGAGVEAGGTITFTTAPAAGGKVVIYNDPPATQLTDYTPNGRFPAESHERALDKLTLLVQRIRSRIDRLISFPETSTVVNPVIANPIPGEWLRYNAAGDGIESSVIALPDGVYPIATESEAEAGTLNDVLMTPLRVAQSAGKLSGVFVADRTALKAIDSTKTTAAYLKEAGREGQFIWKTGDFTTALASDGFEGIYIKADAVPITAGCWVRRRKDYYFYMDWFGARTAADVKPIFDKVKLLAAGCTLRFGAAQYTTSNTLVYEAAGNAPLTISGAGETLTEIINQGTGFTIEYYGGAGGGNEARGGGVSHMKLSKSGTGTCSGVDIANVYFGSVHHVEASGGNIGFRVTGRGAGDTDATFGFSLNNCRARNGRIGFQIRGDTSGSVVAAQIEFRDNDFAGNSVCAAWIACVDQVFAQRNIYVGSGHTAGGVENGRGQVFIEYFGGHVRNYRSAQNEYGNGTTGCTYNVIIDALIGGEFIHERHIRNDGDVSNGAYLLGFAQTAVSITGVRFYHDYIVAAGASPYTVFAAGGTSMSYAQNVVIDPQYISIGGSVTKYAATSIFADIIELGQQSSFRSLNYSSANAHTFDRTGSDGSVLAFKRGGVVVGSVSVTGSTTSYNPTSDEDRKIFKGEYDPAKAIALIKADPVREFEWKPEFGGQRAIGWGAQTSYELEPDLAIPGYWADPKTLEEVPEGTADAIRMPWTVKSGKREVYLWAAVSHLISRIETLEAQLSADKLD